MDQSNQPVAGLAADTLLTDALAPYREARRPVPPGRPWVMANMVAGLDGSAAVNGRVGALSDDVDRRLFKQMRSLADVVLVGASTVRAERYGPVQLEPELVEWRTAHDRQPVPPIAVVSASLNLDVDLPLFRPDQSTRPMVVTGDAAPESARQTLEPVADVVVAGSDGVDLREALRQLRARGAEVVLCEGGPSLLGQLVESDLLDELCLTLSAAMGGDSLPMAVSPATSELARFDLAHVLQSGSTLFLRYVRSHEEDG